MPSGPQAAQDPVADAGNHRHLARVITCICLAICAIAVIIGAIAVLPRQPSTQPDPPGTGQYLGLYDPSAPGSYSGIDNFAQAIGRQPNLVVYYSTWLEPFQANFAAMAAQQGAVTLVQIDTGNATSLAAVAAGQDDRYLRSYALAVKSYGGQVILSFDHEMNGDWYPWGYRQSSPHTFVAAWRHVVTLFRQEGASNVTWMWTINVFNASGRHVAAPGAWWPGRSYVDWVGIDGYYNSPSVGFDGLFGPTIADARMLTHDPILIAETGVSQAAGQSAKFTEIFAGIHTFQLLGLVLFDQDGKQAGENYQIASPSVFETLRRDASTYLTEPKRKS
jgi:mannan endo-1,4-beta-mannosidase